MGDETFNTDTLDEGQLKLYEKAIHVSAECQTLLMNPIFATTVDKVEREIFSEWKQATTPERVMELHKEFAALTRIVESLKDGMYEAENMRNELLQSEDII